MIQTKFIGKVGGDYRISPHFTLGEMACRDGSDKVLYSTELMAMLEKLRAYGDFTVSINSGYRSPAYNRKIGGASRSQHIKGTAADITVKKNGVTVDAKLICCLCQKLGFPGVAYINGGAVHVDTRPTGRYRGDERKGYHNNVDDFFSYFRVKSSQIASLATNLNRMEEEEPMTQSQFNEMMAVYLKTLAEQPPSAWSEVERRWAEGKGLVRGDENGKMKYQSFCTREEVVTLLHRAIADSAEN